MYVCLQGFSFLTNINLLCHFTSTVADFKLFFAELLP